MFRFLELELHGWDFWPSFRVPLDADVVVLSGPNGSGKTTVLDAVRQVLHAPRLSQNRRLAHYLRHPNRPVLLRAVVSNRADEHGRRPFERQRVFTDEATLACALVPDGGSPEKRYLVLPGRVPGPDLQERLLGGRDWFGPEEYRRILEYAGVSRSLMHILALEQGRADELSRQKPRELFRWVMEARGSQQVLERYRAARQRFADTLKDVERQRAQLLRHQAELVDLERQVRRLDEHLDHRERVDHAERLAVAARFQASLSGLRDLERKLPELRTKATNLATTTDRMRREMAEQAAAIEALREGARHCAGALAAAEGAREEAARRHAVLEQEVGGLRSAAAELSRLAEEDVVTLREALDRAREGAFDAAREGERLAASLSEIEARIRDLERGVPRFPPPVERTLEALAAAGIAATLSAPQAEITADEWAAGIESALGPLRYAVCVAAEDERRASAIAREHDFPGPIVTDLTGDDTTVGLLSVRAGSPRWLPEWASEVRLTDEEHPPQGVALTRDGTRRDRYGVWVSRAAGRVLGGGAVRAQLEAARRERVELGTALETAGRRRDQAASAVRDLDARIRVQERRFELAEAVACLPEREQQLQSARADLQARRAAQGEAGARQREADQAVMLADAALARSEADLERIGKELEGNRAAVIEMETRRAALEPEVESLGRDIDSALKARAERNELSSPELAERDAEQARRALARFEADGPIPDEHVREQRRVAERRIDELHRHVRDRQEEAEAAGAELDRCRGDYLQVVRSTLNDYARRARALAELALARLEVDLPRLENDDRLLDEAGIVVRIGFDGKPPTEIADTSHSGGQQVISGLILLMAMAETEGDAFFVVDEPFAHLSLDRIDDVGRFLKRSGAQFLITVPTTLDRGQLDPASLLIVLKKKGAAEPFAPRPLIARA